MKPKKKEKWMKHTKPSCFLTQYDHFMLQNQSPAMAKIYGEKFTELTPLLHNCSSQHLLQKSWAKTYLDLPISYLTMKQYVTKLLYLFLLPLTIKASTAFHALQHKFYNHLLHWKKISNLHVKLCSVATSHMRNKSSCILLNFYANCSSLAAAFPYSPAPSKLKKFCLLRFSSNGHCSVPLIRGYALTAWAAFKIWAHHAFTTHFKMFLNSLFS